MLASSALAEDYNLTQILERSVEAGRGDKVAVVAGDRVLSYDQLRRKTNQAAHLLRSLGVQREDRVLLVLDDSPAFPIMFLGALRVGAVPVPVSPLDKPENHRHYVEDSYTGVVVAESALIRTLHRAVGRRNDVLYLSAGGSAARAVTLEDALAAQDEEFSPTRTHRDDAAFWLYSSGSTGRPKGVVHLHHDIEVTCETYARHVLEIREDDVLFSTTKLHHAYGLGNGLSFPLWFGATVVLMSGPTKPEPIFATLRRHRPTVFFSVPALYSLMLRDASSRDEFDSVRLCVSAGEALPAVTFKRWRERFGHEILDGVGSTEMLHIYCSNRQGDTVPGSSGRPVPGYELRLVDEAGSVLAGEAIGTLEVRGDSCATFYWHQHEKTKASMRGDWFVTGDRYHRTEEGYYKYVGRNDDMFKVSGLWVSPSDMESVLLEHPHVLGVGVVATTIDDMSRIAAYVVRSIEGPDDDQLTAELRERCKQRLRRYEVPHAIWYLDDLPRTATGKVQRYALRAMEGERADASTRRGRVTLKNAR